MSQQTSPSFDPAMQECIQNCLNCYRTCLETITHCLQMGGHHAEPSHIRLMMDCADMCLTSANFMIRGSDLHRMTCGICAEVCQRCYEACARFRDDESMRACAEACRRCAESCRQMAA